MNNNEITCFVDMFAAHQKVEYSDGQVERVSLTDLTKFLPQVCFSENINRIHLYGDAQFCNGVANDIRMIAVSTYGQNDIEIEVN